MTAALFPAIAKREAAPTTSHKEAPVPPAQSILFVTGSLSEESSGPFLSLKQTAQALQQRRHRVTVIGTRRAGDRDPDHWSVEARGFRSYGPYSAHFAPGLGNWLNRQPDAWDVVSMQGVWLHTNRAVAAWCIRQGKPFMITAHGNFNSIALRISAWKKWLALKTYMGPVLNHVTCYQALTEIEYSALRDYGIREPICVIGHGIDLPERQDLPNSDPVVPKDLRSRRTCLYLGRLHPIKGVDRLLRAWARLRPSDGWQLIIAGDGVDNERAELEAVASRACAANVHFVGRVTGEIKAAWFRQADLFVLPSRSEAFPMALMEAFSYGIPAMITTACGMPDAAQTGAAVEVESSDDGIHAGLEKMLQLPRGQLRLMGAAGRSFVSDCYSWPNICRQLESVYAWMQTKGTPPPCLRVN